MGRTLVLAEKPSVGREIARVLGCNKKHASYIEGSKYIVTWALGHLVTLAQPEIYNKKYMSWNLEDLPMLPQTLKLVVIKKSAKQFNEVKKQMLRNDVNEIIIATDAGREGELVARWIIQKAHVKKPIKRLWVSSVTDKAIRDGFKNLKSGNDYIGLYNAAAARAEADWIVGINATRALTCKHNAQLSCGRVQTPTLAMIAQREEEIKSFKPKEYYTITALSNNLKFTWKDKKTNESRIFNHTKVENIIKNTKDEAIKIVDVKKKSKKIYSPKLYDLTELQRDANKMFGFSAKETLSIMQRLYERHKILTYPRTDSRYLTKDIVGTLKERLKACSVSNHASIGAKLLKKNITASKNFVDDSKVSDHHAIIPTEEPVLLSSLDYKERKIYDLVVKRFMSVLYPPYEAEEYSIKAEINDENFTTKYEKTINKGWKEIYEDLDNKELLNTQFARIKTGENLKLSNISYKKDNTKPPAPLNEASLLSAMENPAKYMSGEKKDLIKTIGEAGGIGTVATRADIIEKLFTTKLLEKKGKDIFTTAKGRQLLKLVPEDLKSPAMTAKWERKLNNISKGKLNRIEFINEMRKYTEDIVGEIKDSKEKFKHSNVTRSKCPNCGKLLLEINNKKGKMLVCQDRTCGYKKVLARLSNARCPECHKKMELWGEGEAQLFVCSCGHREKLSTFKDRKKQKKNQASKKDVMAYMKKQKKSDDNFNSALADALAGLINK